MPNKHKMAKLRARMLNKGLLTNTDDSKRTLEYLRRKAEIDNEDVNYDFDEKAAGFKPLEDGDSCGKATKSNKRKQELPFGQQDPSKKKFKVEGLDAADAVTPKKEKKVATEAVQPGTVPKKSKKNKYYHLAHPSEENKTSEKKKQKNKNNAKKEEKGQKKKQSGPKKTKLSNNIWIVEELGEDDDDDEPLQKPEEAEKPQAKKKNKVKSKEENGEVVEEKVDNAAAGDDDQGLRLTKAYKVSKRVTKMDDGTMVETFMPEVFGGEEHEDDDDDDDDENENEEEFEEGEDDDDNEEEEEQVVTTTAGEKKKKPAVPAPSSAAEKLQSSRFRYLNELLYTQTGDKSYEYFKNDKDAFVAYHQGFQNQKDKWPLQPVDVIIKYIKAKANPSLVVADFGCGDAKVARSCTSNKVHSFDLVALNPLVTECDMKRVPLNAESCDIAVFCLSLMGTNVCDFLCEAHRILKKNGVLKIAEVVSRIENKSLFLRQVESIGFKLVNNKQNNSNTSPNEKNSDYFYFFDFVKVSPSVKSKPDIKLKSCLYKKR